MTESSENNIGFVIGFLVLVITLVIGASLFNTYKESVLTSNSSSTSQFILTDNGTSTTLTPTEEGITSNSATHKNKTWLEFDRVNDAIATNLIINTSLNINISFCCWINFTEYPGGSGSTYIIIDDIYINRLYLYSSSVILFDMYNSSNARGLILSYSTPINDSMWHQICGIRNDTHKYLVIDGSIVAIQPYTGGGYDTNKTFSISIPSSLGFNGSIDEVRIYNRSLGDSEILEIYYSGMIANHSLNQSELILYQGFNENSGTTAYDSSGNSNHGTISGATWNNDGVDINLTENIDYTLIGAIFTILNDDLAWTGITSSWSYTTDIINAADYDVANSTEEGLGEFGNWFKILIIISIAGFILFLILNNLGFFGNESGGSY